MPERLGPAAWFKITDQQYLEIYQTLRSEDEDRLIEVAFQTPDAKGMRGYLASKGVEVPATVGKGWDGNLSFQVNDPEGHRIGFVQYLTDSIPGKQFGLLMPGTRISEHMIHAGFLVKDRASKTISTKTSSASMKCGTGVRPTLLPTGSACASPMAMTGSNTCAMCRMPRRKRAAS